MACIVIVDYRSSWPDEFAELAANLSQALGTAALRVDHIGSTAVPGLAAKDVIDIQITVSTLATWDTDHPAMSSCGATRKPAVTTDHCPPGMTLTTGELEKHFYSVGAQGERPANIHVREAGRFNQRYALLCRDYLRASPDAANAYAEIKRQLARHFADDVDAYYDVKDPVFDLIMAGAREWAEATAWQP